MSNNGYFVGRAVRADRTGNRIAMSVPLYHALAL